MTVERSKRRSQFLSLVFITKCFNKNLLLRYENIYQIVLSKRSSKRKAKLIKKEMIEMIADKIKTEGMTLKEKLKKSIAEKKREREKGVYKENKTI